jgi:uncharacterized ferritin-like protein (DUF455 family)
LACRDVDARLDDRGADEHVRVAAQERHHPRLELGVLELAVGDFEAHARAQAAQSRGDLVDRLDAVVQVERLAPRARSRSSAWRTSVSSYSPT